MSGGGGDNKVKDTPEQKALAQVAAEKWNFAQENLAPLEDQYMAHVDQMDSAGNMSYIRGRTMQAQAGAQSQAQSQMEAGLGRAGINPNSGRFQGEVAGLGNELAQAGGETLGRAEFEQDNQKIMGLQNITDIGQGQAGQAQAGMSRLAQESSSNAIGNAQNAFNRRSANLQLLGTVAGAGTRYGMQASAPAPEQLGLNSNLGPDYQMNTGGDGGFYDYARGW